LRRAEKGAQDRRTDSVSAARRREVAMTAPTAPRGPSPHLLDAALKRRAELRESSRTLVRALEAASPGREAEWMGRVLACLDEFREDITEHIESTEAADGLYDEVRAAQPRLTHQVGRLVAEHVVLRERVDAVHALAANAGPSPTADVVTSVRNDATALVSLLQRHRQHGSDLIFEAYETDIGGNE
jgi:hypothetical protein